MKYIILILSFLVIFFAIKSCNRDILIKDKLIIKVDTLIIKKDSLIYQELKIFKTEIVKIPQKVDTIKIIQDFFNNNFYSDTINKDDNIIVINDTISNNKIKGRSINLSFNEKFITKTITIIKPTYPATINLGISYNFEKSKPSLYLGFSNKKFEIFANLGFSNSLGFSYKIALK